MDPVSAIGLASSVVQLVDFGSKLVSAGNELYKKGSLAEHVELQEIGEEFKKLSKNIQNSLKPDYYLPDALNQNAPKQTPEEDALESIAIKCNEIAQEFIDALDQLKSTGGRWKSFGVAIKTVWTKEDINKMQAKLKMYESQLVVHLLVVLKTRQTYDTKAILESQELSENNIVKAIKETQGRITSQITELSQDLEKQSSKDERLLPAILSRGQESKRQDKRQEIINRWQENNSQELAKIADQWSQAADVDKRTSDMLHSLYFPEWEERYTNVTQAYAKTFNWIFERPEESLPWDDFRDWLEKDGGSDKMIYWIAGKPGSGKSTLMRYLSRDKRTKNYLQRWAGGKALLTASCFFWNLGSPMQKSQKGLIQSLLYQLLRQRPDLCEVASPWRWNSYEPGVPRPGPWNTNELLRVFNDVIDRLDSSSKMCFFIDGLDEFEGNEAAHTELIELLIEISELRFGTIKICVSSRPWDVFRISFEQRPCLKLQDLTANDIKTYVKDVLEKDAKFRMFQRNHTTECAELIKSVVHRAAGVFLWVYLVVRSLKEGLQNLDTVRDLQRRLDAIPDDLQKYFSHMMGTLDPFYLREASHLFQVAMKSHETLSLMTCTYVEEESDDFALQAEIKGLSLEEIKATQDRMARRLDICCKGLLEWHAIKYGSDFFAHNVAFMHRTVKEFLQTDEAQVILRSDKSSVNKIDVDKFLCQAYLAQIKSFELGKAKASSFLTLLRRVFDYALALEKRDEEATIELLDELDRTIIYLYRHGKHTARISTPEDHWTNWVAFDDKRIEILPLWRSSFLTLTIQLGFEVYPKEKLDQDPDQIKARDGRPLLDYALGPGMRGPLPRPDVDISDSALEHKPKPNFAVVEYLLERGADPNQAFSGETIWASFLNLLLTQGQNTKGPDYKLYEVTELLIKHGAAKEIVLSKEKGCQTLKSVDVIQRAFGSERARRLQSKFQGQPLNDGLRPRPIEEQSQPVEVPPELTIERPQPTPSPEPTSRRWKFFRFSRHS
ncbi:MAG: hypothetical protein MMC33_010316 [Icmadophila ericetorum]|nr:hypothetical protein [Icmadophila ericetorum]